MITGAGLHILRTNDKIQLPDRTVTGTFLTDGKMTGLRNLVRTGTAVLDKRFNAINGSFYTYFVYSGQTRFI